MSRAIACALLLAGAASPSRAASTDQDLVRKGLQAMRGLGPAGEAMYDYIEEDPVPIRSEPTPPEIGGYYNSEGSGRPASIVLSDRLRAGEPEGLAVPIFHEYVHRLEDRLGILPSDHSPEGLSRAMDLLGRRVRPNAPRLAAPKGIRWWSSVSSRREPVDANASSDPRPRGDASFMPRRIAAFSTAGSRAVYFAGSAGVRNAGRPLSVSAPGRAMRSVSGGTPPPLATVPARAFRSVR